jgi:hypothetical protein
MGYVENAIAMFFSELCKSTFLKLCPTKKMWGIKLSFHWKKNLNLDKNSALGDFSKSNTHSENGV